MNPVSSLLPNPKPASAKVAARWYRYYAMFSEDFAAKAITTANLPKNALVIDPWVGTGTTTAVAAQAGLRSVGVDINPAMVAIANGRCVVASEAKRAIETLHKNVQKVDIVRMGEDPLVVWFKNAAATRLRQWHNCIVDSFPEQTSPQTSGFLNTVLFETAWELAKSYRSKNPTWVKPPLTSNRIAVRTKKIDELILSVAEKKLADCPQTIPALPSILCGSSTDLHQIQDADFVLTSPPYCTRIDYAVSTRIELALLGMSDGNLGQLRDSMMGTSTIRRDATGAETEWGATCNALLDHVLHHPSKSSANYYHKNFLQYFADLYRSLKEINRVVRRGAGIGQTHLKCEKMWVFFVDRW